MVTQLGSSAVTLPLTALAALLLAVRRRWVEAAVVVVATAIIYAGVAELQGADRPPPAGRSADRRARQRRFPSGHAAHSVIYPWLALTLAVRLRPGMAGGSALLLAGVALAVASGSRASTWGSTT